MSPGRERTAAGARRSSAPGGAKGHPPDQPVPLLEWVVGGLGAALDGCAIAFLVYHAVARGQTPPDISVMATRVLDLENGYLVQFRALNQGGSAAAELTIEGELTGAEGELELSEVVLDYLPPRSGREGGLVFAQDPRAGRLTLRAKSYAKP